MGVKLKDLFNKQPINMEWLEGKTIAIDANNVAFRYLTSLRDQHGDFLKSENGVVTSHIYGFLGLIGKLRRAGAEPIIIWDGPVHERKQNTVDERRAKRLDAQHKLEKAREEGNWEDVRKYSIQATYLSKSMIRIANMVFDSVGVTHIEAPNDAERYAAILCQRGLADAVATEDYDSLVAGAPYIVRKCGSPDQFIHQLTDIKEHNLTREQLIDIAIVTGTDWHPGVKGFGAKTALKAINDAGPLLEICQEAADGCTDTRYHKLFQKSDLTPELFQELKTYINEQPETPIEITPPEIKLEQMQKLATELNVNEDRFTAAIG